MKSVCEIRELIVWGCGGGGEKARGEVSVSYLRIRSRELGRSQGGGRMLALRWRFRRRASQRGKGARWGGRRVGVGPWGWRTCQFGGKKLDLMGEGDGSIEREHVMENSRTGDSDFPVVGVERRSPSPSHRGSQPPLA
jgi:hypothetical protein